MGAFLDKPKTDKTTTSGSLEGDLRYGVAAMQGWRVEMEDAHTSVAGLPDHEKWSFFGVFDGHAGSKCAGYTSDHILNHLMRNMEREKSEEDASSSIGSGSIDKVKEAIRQTFLGLDEEIQQTPNWSNGKDLSGTTAITCLVTEDHIIFANCGDSRGLLCRRGEVVFSTEDHKPYLERERERIEKAGGCVVLQRVNGSLAVSRALGDIAYKRPQDKPAVEQIVSPEPDVVEMRREEGDEFVVLACDGIWDVMDNNAVMEFVRRKLRVCSDLETIAGHLIDNCFHKGSRDNMSVVIVTFRDAPTVTEEALKEEEENRKEAEKQIEEKLKELVKTNELEKLDEHYVMSQLCSDLSEHLNISSRRDFVVELLEKLMASKTTSKGLFGRKK
ncbi:protein phosphatase 1B-like isoform X2 [Corticium candelabrum]|uniref:protein phosphatase 1B-like isoform X2 n=1 Tax=Corticium candelabrum TaxID=121492 RepID=UPI002E276D1E|nr:protein phosphatase 1B-like isoform X2 [Corticium candelabrum]